MRVFSLLKWWFCLYFDVVFMMCACVVETRVSSGLRVVRWALFYSGSHIEISTRKTDLQFLTFLTLVLSTMKLVMEYLDYRTSKRAD
jgi:hypothetical protein